MTQKVLKYRERETDNLKFEIRCDGNVGPLHDYNPLSGHRPIEFAVHSLVS